MEGMLEGKLEITLERIKVGNERSKLGEHHKRAKRAEHTSEQNPLSANERAR
jgi:hypothetical protein